METIKHKQTEKTKKQKNKNKQQTRKQENYRYLEIKQHREPNKKLGQDKF